MRALDVGIVIDLDAAGRRVQPEHVGHAFQQFALGAVLRQAAAQLLARIGAARVSMISRFSPRCGMEISTLCSARSASASASSRARQCLR